MVEPGARRVGLLLTVFLAVAAMPAAAEPLDGAYLGTWASGGKQCAVGSDMRVEITQTGMSGPEFACTVIQAVRQGEGWALRLDCAVEGTEFTVDQHWQLMPNGTLRQTENEVVRDYLPCRGSSSAEAETALPAGGLDPATLQGADAIRYVQRRLGEMGFDPGVADGRFGARTARALRAFETARGLPETGRIGPATLTALAVAEGRPAEQRQFDPQAINASIRAIIDRYRPTTDAYDYREAAGEAALAGLLKPPPFGPVDIADFERRAEMPGNYVVDTYTLIGYPSIVTPGHHFFASPEHRVLTDDLKRLRLAQQGMTRGAAKALENKFRTLLAKTEARLGAAHPAVGFILVDLLSLLDDMNARFEGGGGVGYTELGASHEAAAAAMLAGWSLSPSGKTLTDNILARLTIAAQRADGSTAGCDERRKSAYVKAAAIDHATSGATLRQIGWLIGLARCTKDAGTVEAIMRARLFLARKTGSAEAVAQTLVDLGAALFAAGERTDARAAYREAFRVATVHRLTGGYVSGFLADTEWTSTKRTTPSHWTVLMELGLDAELDLYIAEVLRRQIADRLFESTHGANVVSSFVDVLEGSGRTALADQYYTYIGHTYRREGMKGSVSPLYMMTLFAAQRLDSERYEEALPILERGLKIAEGLGDRRFTIMMIAALARAHTERGALDEGLGFARRGLVMVKQTGLDGADPDLKAAAKNLNQIVTDAEREQSRLDNAVGGLAADLQRSLKPVCDGKETWAFPPLPAGRLLSNPAIAEAFLQHPVVVDYIDCFNRRLEAFAGPGVQPGEGAADRVADVALLFGLLKERERATALLDALFAKGEKGLGAQAAALQGLVRSGRGDWFLPYAGRAFELAMATLPKRREQDWFPQPASHIGLDLLAIGERSLSERLYRQIKADWEEKIAARGWGCMLEECQYFAVMTEAFDAGHGAETYYGRIPRQFSSYYSGAQTDTSEADAIRHLALNEGHMQLRARRYRLAEVYFQLALDVVSGYGPTAKGVMASEGEVDVETALARIKYERGDPAAARDITLPVVKEARRRFADRHAYSTEAIVRWSHRLRGLFEVHFDSLEADAAGEIAADEDDFFAFQYLQTTRTAATVARLAERASSGSGKAVRRHQDLSRELSDLYSAVAVASGGRAAALLIQIAEKEKEVAAAAEAAEASVPAYAARPGFRFLSLAETRRGLGEGEAVLLSFVGQHHAYLWLVTRSRSSLKRLAISPAALDEEVRAMRDGATAYRESVENRPWPLRAFRRPYLSTLGVFGADIAAASRLYFVPHGLFDGLPLAALLTRDPPAEDMTFTQMRAARLPWLIRRTAINMLPSLQAIEHLPQAAGGNAARRPFLGIGNPDFGAGLKVASLRGLSPVRPLAIPLLPETETEITRIAEILKAAPAEDLLVGARASEAVIRKMALDNYRIVTFATHGILAGEFRGVTEPALVLAMPAHPQPEDDGLLTASEVSSLRLNAELVVLSACNTAGSDGRPGAEGLSGLANAFFYAGAQNLVVTHWAIPSNPAVGISVGMVEAQRDAAQPDWAKALQSSILKMMDGDGPVAYVHPGAWGAHMVVGPEVQ
jgi:CHAT domain-containing protein/tetratricopeptide (TPR) repeat protein